MIKSNKQAFTLIELLVVVLIIGILAAVAVPQYQQAVQKSRNAELKMWAKTLAVAQQNYQLANGTKANGFSLLDVDFPADVTNPGSTEDDGMCGFLLPEGSNDAVRRGDDWQAVITPSLNVVIMWTQGKYKCAGFRYSSDTLQCFVNASTLDWPEGKFCTKVEKGSFRSEGSDTKYYNIP